MSKNKCLLCGAELIPLENETMVIEQCPKCGKYKIETIKIKVKAEDKTDECTRL